MDSEEKKTEVRLIANSYGWHCPECGENHKVKGITNFVVCTNCDEQFPVNDEVGHHFL